MSPASAELQQVPIPPLVRLHRLFDQRWARGAYDFEWTSRFDPETGAFSVAFFVARIVFHLELILRVEQPVLVEHVTCHRNGRSEDITFAIESHRDGQQLRILITPLVTRLVDKLAIHLKAPVPSFEGRLAIAFHSQEQDDMPHVVRAHQLMKEGDFKSALYPLRDYEAFATNNPWVMSWLSTCYCHTGNLERAELYSQRAIAAGDPGVELALPSYRAVQDSKPRRSVDEIRRLQAEAGTWDVGGSPGAIALDLRREFTLGLGDYYIRAQSHLLEIRRWAAARMLRSLTFAFAAHREQVLHTSMRVVHANGDTEVVPVEHFTISDHTNKNILITVEDERAGHWILPDLAPGDVIDWTYHVLTRSRTPKEAPNVFIFSPLCDLYFPTLRASAAFAAPAGQPFRYLLHNADLPERRTQAENQETIAFEIERFVPARGTGFPYENEYLDPTVICVSGGDGWADVAREALSANFGSADIEDALPEPLATLTDHASDTLHALEDAYYWVRDKLKYASTPSGQERIGQAGRAKRILDSGVGNCNDKSYLLSLVCRRLGMPSEYLAMSSKHGLLVDETPANQFDHVLLRAQLNGKCIYLDAANDMSPFGTAPAWCQGMRALALRDGAIVAIPEDDPESNAVSASETFGTCRDGLLHGRFRLSARGHSGRHTDELWKRLSLGNDDPHRADQDALGLFLPSARVFDTARESDTSTTNAFCLSGRHARGPLVALKSGKVGVLAWQAPFLHIRYWQTLRVDRLFVFEFPLQLTFEARFEGELSRHLIDVSSVKSIDDPVIHVSEDVLREGDALSVRRTIMIKKKFVRPPELDGVPAGLNRIERALQLVVTFDEGC